MTKEILSTCTKNLTDPWIEHVNVKQEGKSQGIAFERMT